MSKSALTIDYRSAFQFPSQIHGEVTLHQQSLLALYSLTKTNLNDLAQAAEKHGVAPVKKAVFNIQGATFAAIDPVQSEAPRFSPSRPQPKDNPFFVPKPGMK